MTEQKNIHDFFLEQTKSSKNREDMALKLKKTPWEINSLTAYHDFRRLTTINKHLAKIYIVAGIRWVSHLAKLTKTQVEKKIKSSRIGRTVLVNPSLIESTIKEAKSTPIIISGLEREKFFLQRKWYILSKSDISQIEQTPDKKNYNDIILLVITLFILWAFSLVSLYFLAFIPVLFGLHALLESNIGKILISPLKNLFWNWWIKWVSAALVWIFSCVFAIWFFSGNIHKNIQSSLGQFSWINKLETQSYFPKEVHDYYQQKDITREDLIKILSVATKINLQDQDEIECFNDSFQSRYPKEICYAKELWYIQWDSLWNIYPNKAISHGAGLKFILNYYGYGVPKRSLYLTYTDLQKNQWQTTYAEFAKRINLIDESITEFYPDKTITIEQVDRYISVLSSSQKQKTY